MKQKQCVREVLKRSWWVGSANFITLSKFLQCKHCISSSEHPFELVFWLRNRTDISLSIHMIFAEKRQNLSEQRAWQRDLLQNFLHYALSRIPSHKRNYMELRVMLRKKCWLWVKYGISWNCWKKKYRYDLDLSKSVRDIDLFDLLSDEIVIVRRLTHFKASDAYPVYIQMHSR